MRPDVPIAGPVVGIIGVPGGRAPADQDAVHLVLGVPLLLLGHVVPDHRLHQAVHLDAGTPLVHLGQRVPADLADDPGQQHPLLQGWVVLEQVLDRSLAVEQAHRDGLR